MQHANKDHITLAEDWSRLTNAFHLNEAEKPPILAALAVCLARWAHLSAGAWLQKFKPDYADVTLRE
ncbi:uncharacterized protein TNCV_551251 [Trichonephila clavipes]|nr:uncharacterized protein TNCV_551251 [Trichonephila clavipes]